MNRDQGGGVAWINTGATCQDGFTHELMNTEKSSQVPQQERNRREENRCFQGMNLAQATNERRVGCGGKGSLTELELRGSRQSRRGEPRGRGGRSQQEGHAPTSQSADVKPDKGCAYESAMASDVTGDQEGGTQPDVPH